MEQNKELSSSRSPRQSINKEQINQLPTALFEGRVHVVQTEEALEAAIADLSTHQVIGFDTETKPSFKKGQINKVSLLQLSTDSDCYLIRLHKVGFSPALAALFCNSGIVVVGLSIRDDFSGLNKITKIKSSSVIELQQWVEAYGIADKSLQKIYAIVFGHKISKSQRLTNWEAEELTVAQQYYAATDAWACLRIYKELSTRNPVSL